MGQWQEIPLVIPQEIIIDNDEAGTSYNGYTTKSSNKAYNGSYRESIGSSGSYQYTWTPAGLKLNKTYDVYAWWPGIKQHDVAQYTIYHNGQSDSITQDQSKNGQQWVLLGSYTFSGDGSEYIRLTGHKTAADAIRLVEQTPAPPPPPPTQEVIIDNDDPDTSSTGTWTSTNSDKAYNGSYRLSNNQGNTYRWTPSGLNASTYDVYARWPGVKQHNSSAQYTIVHDGQTDTSTQDQSKTGNQWVLLGSYTFTGSGSEYIELSDSGGKTAADGIRLVEQAGSGGPTYGEVWYAIHNDHLGTPQFMTDLNQQIAWSQSHSAFGEATIDEDPDGDGTVITYNQRFPGQYFDGESGLHYNYFRDYDPQTGRYIQSDPIGLNGGLNTYGYVRGNPLNFLDPLGLKITGIWKSEFSASVSAGIKEIHLLDFEARILPPAVSLAKIFVHTSGNGFGRIQCTETDECGNLIRKWELAASVPIQGDAAFHVPIAPLPSYIGLAISVGLGFYELSQYLSFISLQEAKAITKLISTINPTEFCGGS